MVVSSETPRMPLAHSANQPFGFSFRSSSDQGEEDHLFIRARLVEESDIALLGLQAIMHQHGGVAAIVEDHIRRAAAMPVEHAGGVFPVLSPASRPCRRRPECRGRDGGCGVILRRIDVARHPADVGTSAFSVSISTAVWMVMCSVPAMRAPLSGCLAPNSSRTAIRPGISVSARSISLRRRRRG